MVQSQGFQSGDTVELRVKRRGGGIDWLPAQVRKGERRGGGGGGSLFMCVVLNLCRGLLHSPVVAGF